MKVYILVEYDYDGNTILGVYKDSDKAYGEYYRLKDLEKNAKKYYRNYYGVEEYDIIE